jgi:cytochrome oxidase Cu insertion factor (SCO1/SenC/PrrC family)
MDSKWIRMAFIGGFSLLGAMFLLAGAWLWWNRPSALSELQVLGVVPDFSLIERNGQTVTASQLEGKIWIADFIFTNCSGPCPIITARMAKLQKRYANQGNLRFVSITVDPARDTPAVLSRYAELYGASKDQWLFLTGEHDSIHNLATRGMMLAMTENTQDQAGGDTLLHSLRFVLVDEKRQIRGYYNATEDAAMARLEMDLNALLGKLR